MKDKKYDYVLLKHPKHYGEKDELAEFLEEASECGWEIEQVVDHQGWLTLIYSYVHTTDAEFSLKGGVYHNGTQ